MESFKCPFCGRLWWEAYCPECAVTLDRTLVQQSANGKGSPAASSDLAPKGKPADTTREILSWVVFLSNFFGKRSAWRRVLKFLPAALALGLSFKLFGDSRISQPELGDVACLLGAMFFLVASIIAFFTALIIETYNGSPNTSLNSKAAHNSDSGTMAASNAKPAAERDEPISTKTP